MHFAVALSLLAQTHSSSPGTVVGIVIAVFVLVGALISYFLYLERKRSEKIATFASSLGFTFRRKATPADRELLAGSHLRNAGRSPQFSNVLEATAPAEARITLFDFAYTSGTSEHEQTTNQTVMRMEASLLNLPSFFLRPESLLSKAFKLVGLRDINFAEHPEFSKRYLLSGQDEAAVRRVLTPEIIKFCEEHPRICIEGGGNKLLYYREGMRQKPETLEGFLDDGKKLFALFVAASRGTQAG